MNNVRRGVFAVLILGLVALGIVGLTALVGVFVRHPLESTEICGAIVVATLVVGIAAAKLVRRIPANTIIELDLPLPPPEVASRDPLSRLSGRRPLTLEDTITALGRASRDQRIRGLVLRPRFASAPRAVIEELRGAILAFGEAGKFTVAVADSFGEGGPANSGYHLATSCREIVVHPTGLVGMTPLSLERNFYRGLLDNIGVDVEVFARREFKSALSQLSEHKFTDPDREQNELLLNSLWSRQVDDVARARKLKPEQVRLLAEKAPLLAHEALAGGLVDRLAYTDEVMSTTKAAAGRRSQLLYLATYNKRAGRDRQKGKSVPIAVLHAVGEIHRSSTLPIGLRGGPLIAADRFIPQIRAAAQDKKAQAFVLRIDSPGGSAVASDAIWRELVVLRELGKPLIVSMGAVAASGGYYLATAADRVVAEPGTITGSIGVISMHPVLSGAKEKLSISTDEVHTSTESSMFSVNHPLTLAQRDRMDAQLDATYDTFTRRVAEGRHLAIEHVLEIAKGRVWTGGDAANIGLVDELGGLERAIALAVELTGAPQGTRGKPTSIPRRKGLLSRLHAAQPASSDDLVAAHARKTSDSLGVQGGVNALVHGDTPRWDLMFHLGSDPRSYWFR